MGRGAADVVDVDGGAFIYLAGPPGNHQRNAQRLRRHQRGGNALGFHGEHEVGRGVIEFARDDHAHLAHDLRHAQNIAQIEKAAGQQARGGAQLLAQLAQERPRVLAFHHGAVAHAAGCAGHGIQLAQTKGVEHAAQQVDVLAQGGLCRPEHFTKIRQGENAVGRRGEQLGQRRHSFVALDAFHGLPPC